LVVVIAVEELVHIRLPTVVQAVVAQILVEKNLELEQQVKAITVVLEVGERLVIQVQVVAVQVLLVAIIQAELLALVVLVHLHIHLGVLQLQQVKMSAELVFMQAVVVAVTVLQELALEPQALVVQVAVVLVQMVQELLEPLTQAVVVAVQIQHQATVVQV
jgi:hypothetical protein